MSASKIVTEPLKISHTILDIVMTVPFRLREFCFELICQKQKFIRQNVLNTQYMLPQLLFYALC